MWTRLVPSRVNYFLYDMVSLYMKGLYDTYWLYIYKCLLYSNKTFWCIIESALRQITRGWVRYLGVINSMQVTGDLLFVEFMNNDKSYLALIDSGAQLNVISQSILDMCEYEVLSAVQLSEIAGVNGAKSRIEKWVLFPVKLANGINKVIKTAVIQFPRPTIIFGIPFLNEVQAKIDFTSSTMDTHAGPMILLQIPKPLKPGIQMTYLPQLDNISTPSLTDAQRYTVLRVLSTYRCLWEMKRQGRCKGMEHVIQLTTTRPICSKARHYCQSHISAIELDITTMIQDKVIRPSVSPYSSEVVMVQKKSGSWRMCIDYRMLNKHTIPDRYPLPRIPDLLRSIKDSKFFVALDLRSGYWQIPMEENSIYLTAFRCPQGLFEFNVMPFGLTNAPATFQRSMDFLLGDLRQSGTSVYLDDILIHSTTFESCLERLQVVLQRLEKAGLTLNIEKCSFFPTELEYLGHIIKEGKLLPNQKRVESLQCIRPPRNLTELRSILGMFGYYQTFIPNYSELAIPLTNALKGVHKGKTSIKWTDKMQDATHTIAKCLQNAVLNIPIDNDEFLLETDASDKAIAGILSVKRNGSWVPIEFMSKKLGGPQTRWPVREKEAFAIVHSLNKFDHFLRSRSFTVHTDHQSLKWMMEATCGKIARWASRMAEYDMNILWKKGNIMQHVDFFSRQVDPDFDLQPRMIYTVSCDPNPLPSMENIILAQGRDIRPMDRGYVTRGSVTYYRNGVWVPPAFRVNVIAACHMLPPFCHSGVKKTKSTIIKVFNWAGLHDDVNKYVRGCLTCQRIRPGIERIQGLMKTHPVPGPFDNIYMDIWHCHFGGEAYSVLTMIDMSTKWAEVEHIASHKAEEISDAFLRCWVCRFGVPKILITDNEKGFISEVLKRLLATLGVTQLRTTPYHPQGNAPIESFHRVLSQKLAHLSKNHELHLPFRTALQLALWSYRVVLHSTTRESPAFLVYGMDLRPPFEQDWRFASNQQEKDRIKFLNMMREDIQFQAYQRRLHDNISKNVRRISPAIEEGQLVLVRSSLSERQQAATRQDQCLKLVPRWSLPCRILKVYPGKTRFMIRNLMTGYIRNAHITDVRLIEKPQDDQQRAIWNKEISDVYDSMFDPSGRQKQLVEFWDEVDHPQKKMVLGV